MTLTSIDERVAMRACVGLACITSIACGHAPSAAPSAPAPPSGESRGALGAATAASTPGITPESREFRIVPLGHMDGDAAMLFGHPDSAGKPFVLRIRELPGTIVPPHRHPVDEHVTVVSGTWWFGTGERFDSTALRRMDAGAYAFAPAGTTMFAYSPDGAVVQVHGTGPFHIQWRHGVRLATEPGAASAFRFRPGDRVVTPRGPGRVRQGYASGEIVQYEVEGDGGLLFMASERDVRAP